MAEQTIEEQDDLNEWHDAMSDAIEEILPELPDGYVYHIRTRSFEDGDKVLVVIGAKSRLIDDEGPQNQESRVPTGDPDGWWAEFFADEDDTD